MKHPEPGPLNPWTAEPEHHVALAQHLQRVGWSVGEIEPEAERCRIDVEFLRTRCGENAAE